MVPLGDLPGGDFESRALAVSGDGTVVVGESATALGMQAFRWTVESGMQLLWLGLSTSRATGVNYDGTVIVGTEEGIGAFVWTAESGRHYLVALLGWPRDMVLTEAEGVSHDGRIIIGWGDNNSEGSRAWVVEVDGLFQCIADLNGDDRTNAQDFAIFAAWYGFPVTTGTNGDLNGDGFVNAADFVILASDFGCGVP
jgi:uncharacterized membrane protein